MEHNYVIKDLCDQLIRAASRISSMSASMAESTGAAILVDAYEDMRMTELEHVQVLTLALTRLIAPTEPDAAETVNSDEGDGSVFAQGELDDSKGNAVESEH